MSSTGYGSIGNNGSGSNNNDNSSRDNNLHKRSSFFGGFKPSLEDSRPSTSSVVASTTGPEDYFQTGLGGGEGGDRSSASVVDEKTQRNTTHDSNDQDRIKKEHDMHHQGHQHGPGERCSVPHMMQTMLSEEQHDMVENVVIKVRDSADVTQKVNRLVGLYLLSYTILPPSSPLPSPLPSCSTCPN